MSQGKDKHTECVVTVFLCFLPHSALRLLSEHQSMGLLYVAVIAAQPHVPRINYTTAYSDFL